MKSSGDPNEAMERGEGDAGEASIVMLAAPFVDDAAPAHRKALWFAILTSFPSLGVAGELPLSFSSSLFHHAATAAFCHHEGGIGTISDPSCNVVCFHSSLTFLKKFRLISYCELQFAPYVARYEVRFPSFSASL